MRLKCICLVFLLCLIKMNAQKDGYPVTLIPENLKTNVNSVVREQKEIIEISSISKMNIKTYKAITVFNKNGLFNIEAYEHFDKSRTIKSIEAIIYNQLGVELKKNKKKDFVDVSVAGDAGDITDSRVLYLNYTPTEYPFTIVYESEVETINTAFIPRWYPINDFDESIQKSEFQISYPSDLGFKYKEMYFESNTTTRKEELTNLIKFSVENIEAKKQEELSTYEFPYVISGLDKFSLEGVEGSAKNWKDFGLWINGKLLEGTNELSEETKKEVKSLTINIENSVEKAKVVYKYVQDKTRYVSIQLGIGGWKPMEAKKVDRLGYGDCKALTNYTKALLNEVGVNSYYTVIYGDRDKKDMIEDFVSMQGNHVILSIPNNEKYIHLECTSQTEAFGFLSNFTDDRLALIVKSEGGEIVRTTSYINEQNSKISKGIVRLDINGDLFATLEIKYKGIQYATFVSGTNLSSQESKDKLKERFFELKWISYP